MDQYAELKSLKRGLAALRPGFGEENWITHVATPILFETTRAIGWPLCIATPAGVHMSLWATFDLATSLHLHRRHIGSEIPMSGNSCGIMHLACLEDEEWRILLQLLLDSPALAQIYARDPEQVNFAIV